DDQRHHEARHPFGRVPRVGAGYGRRGDVRRVGQDHDRSRGLGHDLEHGGRDRWLPGGQEGRPRDRGRGPSGALSRKRARRKQMTTAIIGVGNLGTPVARDLVGGGERVVLASRDVSNATALANELGELASAASVEEAIASGDVVVFAVWLETLKDLIAHV